MTGLFGLGVVISACGKATANGGGVTPQGSGSCEDGAQTTYLNPGHNHTLVNLTPAQLSDALVGDYLLLSGGHTHSFSFGAEDFTALQNGQVIQKEDNEGDGHLISISC